MIWKIQKKKKSKKSNSKKEKSEKSQYGLEHQMKEQALMEGKTFTALIQVNENQNRVPLSFDSTMNWNEYCSSLKLAIHESGLDSLKKSEKYVLSYDQTVDGSRYSVILTES